MGTGTRYYVLSNSFGGNFNFGSYALSVQVTIASLGVLESCNAAAAPCQKCIVMDDWGHPGPGNFCAAQSSGLQEVSFMTSSRHPWYITAEMVTFK